MKSKFILEGLNCANCAQQIEGDLAEQNKIKDFKLNFVTKSLVIEHNEDDEEEILNRLKKIVNHREKSVKILKEGTAENRTIEYKKYYIMIFGVLLLVASYYVPSNISIYVKFLAYFITVSNIAINMVSSIKKGSFLDEYFLMFVATFGAMCIGEYIEAFAVLVLYDIGEYLQDLALDNSRKEIKMILDVRSDVAYLKTDNGRVKTDINDIKIGDVIEIVAGESVPLDGVIISGDSYLNTSLITGESVPKRAVKDVEVLSGYINNSSPIVVKVTKIYKESALSKILSLVEDSATNKTQSEKLITKIAKIYTPIVVFLAVLLFVIPTFAFNEPYVKWLHRSLVFLVISCPCALIISIPLSFFSGIGLSSRKGILLKGGNYLEALNEIDAVVLDKTGTITKGVFKVSDVSSKETMYYLKSLEMYSNHPIAKAIQNTEYDFSKDVEKVEEIGGFGISGIVEGKEVVAGNKKFLEQLNIIVEDVHRAIYVACDGKYLGYVVVDDEIKEEAKEVVTTLKNMNKDVFMLTGDSKENAEYVADKVGIDNVRYSLLPTDKLNIVTELEKDKKVLFIGDGMNDAPVIAKSTVGCSMGKIGSDAAIETSDMVFMNDNLSSIVNSFNIAKITRKKVMQNSTFVLLVKIIVLILGAIGIASMWVAIFADVGVTILATLNSVSILKDKKG